MRHQDTDPEDLAEVSNELLGRLRDLRKLEERKRHKEISSPEFHRLAEEIEERARRVWRTAAIERDEGNRVDAPDHPTTEEVAARRPPGSGQEDYSGADGIARTGDDG